MEPFLVEGIKDHVKAEQNRFVFVTALPFVALNDLCLAAILQ